MPIRMSGMISGMDTEALIKELMSAQSMKKTKIEQKKTKLEWKQEKWAELNTKIYKLYTDQISKLRLAGNYATKKVTSSNENMVTATATTAAGSGSHTIKVNELASAQYVTGAKTDLKLTSKLVGDAKMTEGNVIRIASGKGDKAKVAVLEITASTTVSDLVNVMKDAGLNASFDEKQGRFFINSKESGKDNSFAIEIYKPDQTAVDKLNVAKENLVKAGVTEEQVSQYRSLLADMLKKQEAYNKDKTDKNAKKSYDSAVEKVAALEESFYANEAKAIVAKDQADKIKNDPAEYDKLKEAAKEGIYKKDDQGNYTSEFTQEAIDKAKEQGITEAELYNKAIEAAVDKAAADYTSTEEGKKTVEAKIAELKQNSNLKTNMEAYKEEATAYYEAVKDPEKSGALADGKELGEIGLTNLKGDTAMDGKNGGPVVVMASDSEIVLDGATLTGTSNSFSVAGVTYDIKNVTAGETVNINITNDTQAVFNMVKDFVKQYNELVKEMNTLYGAESARGYEPLTEEEKEAMTDKQVELWEKKIKDSLLRRDDTLGSVLNTMRSSLQMSVTVNGTKYSLGSFGIGTGDYTEKGLLHIDGDKDDPAYAEKTDKLTKMFIENPEDTAEALSKIVGNLYKNLQDKMKSTSLSSALTFYNDKEIKKQITSYNKEISRWEERLQDMEDRYYKQFSAMEVALSKMQSQSNYFASMLGG